MKYFLALLLLLPLFFEEGEAQQIINPKASAKNTLTADCAHLYNVGKDYSGSSMPNNLRKGYDTLRIFIERCATVPNGADGLPSHVAFRDITEAVDGMSQVNERWLDYREWLKKVLYLNPDTAYYCEDVNQMLATIAYVLPSTGEVDLNAGIAITDYLIQTNHCPWLTDALQKGRKNTRDLQIAYWKSGDTTIPLDTSAVSIDSIGFSILRGPQFGAVTPRTYQQNFAELTATKNPFSDETILQTSLSDAMMLRLEVYDVLGKSLYSENQFFSAGKMQWKLDGRVLPQGALYARVSTVSGGVKTIKLVRE